MDNVSRLRVFSTRALLTLFMLFSLFTTVRGELDFDVTLHDVQVKPVEGQLANQVKAYVSVLDQQGVPIKNLKANSFALSEDSQRVEATVEENAETPISLVLVMDTSGSMAGPGIASAREASAKFVNRMSDEDTVAVVSFNNTVNVDLDFTENPSVAASTLSNLNVTPGAGTCLYDAIYKSLQLTSTLPAGRRAVLVLTDGRDEVSGGTGNPCSSTVIDDVINQATSNVITPIYAIGVGKEIDENGLQRMALLSGGSFLKSTDFSQMDKMFETMFDQLKYQYQLSYISKALPGKHTLTIQVELGAVKDQDTRDFMIADLPPVITIPSLNNGQTVDGKTLVTTEITGQKQAVTAVEFLLNGQTASRDEESPFAYEIDPSAYEPGVLKITVKALDSSSTVLSESSVEVKIAAPEPTPTISGTPAQPKPTDGPVQEPEREPDKEGNSNIYWIAGGSGFLLIVVLGVVLVAKPFGKNKNNNHSVPGYGSTSDATFDGGIVDALAELTVTFSDDAARVGEKVKISKPIFTIGRSANNDLTFPNDHPVSRRHAQIEQRGGMFWLSEMLSEASGSMKPPTFGTYHNDEKLTGSPVKIKTGDEIRLGNRLKLRFVALTDPKSEPSYEGETIDEMNDATID